MTAALFRSVGLLLWSRHKRVLVGAVVAYAAVFAAARVWNVADYVLTIRLLPLFLALLAAQPVAWSGMDFEGRRSLFPQYLLTLPATGRQLALPFLVYGTAVCAAFWLLSWAVVQGAGMPAARGPAGTFGYALPLEPLLDMALLVWMLAILWSTFRRSFMRVLAALGVIAVAATIHVLVRSRGGAAEPAMIAAAGALLAAGFVVCSRAVERARSAAAPAVEQWMSRRDRPRSHASPLAALVWLDTRVRIRRVWTFTLFFLVIGAIYAYGAVRDGPSAVYEAAAARNPEHAEAYAAAAKARRDKDQRASLLALLPWLVLLGAQMAAPSDMTRGNRIMAPSKEIGLPAFVATLPASSGDHAWSRVLAAAQCMLVPALVWLAVLATAIGFGGLPSAWAEWLASVCALHGDFVFAAGAVATAAAAVAFGCAAAASSVWVTLTGKLPIVVLLANVEIGLAWLWHFGFAFQLDALAGLPGALAGVLPSLAAVKIVGVAALAYAVCARGLFTSRRVAAIVGTWSACVIALVAAYAWIVPDSGTSLGVAAAAIVVVAPVLGILAAPLALQWARVR